MSRRKPVTWNGKRYSSIRAAVRATGIPETTLARWLDRGWSSDDQVVDGRHENTPPTENPRIRPVMWNGVCYPSIKAASEALGVHYKTMQYRVSRGITSSKDLYQHTENSD